MLAAQSEQYLATELGQSGSELDYIVSTLGDQLNIHRFPTLVAQFRLQPTPDFATKLLLSKTVSLPADLPKLVTISERIKADLAANSLSEQQLAIANALLSEISSMTGSASIEDLDIQQRIDLLSISRLTNREDGLILSVGIITQRVFSAEIDPENLPVESYIQLLSEYVNGWLEFESDRAKATSLASDFYNPDRLNKFSSICTTLALYLEEQPDTQSAIRLVDAINGLNELGADYWQLRIAGLKSLQILRDSGNVQEAGVLNSEFWQRMKVETSIIMAKQRLGGNHIRIAQVLQMFPYVAEDFGNLPDSIQDWYLRTDHPTEELKAVTVES